MKKTNKKGNKKRIIKIIISLIFIILSIISLVLILQMNILPFKYIAIIISALCLINILGILGLFKGKWFGKLISIIMYAVIILLTIVSFKYAKSVTKFFENAFHMDSEVTVYDVVVLDDSSYQDIKDLNKKNIGYLAIGDDTSYLDNITDLIDVTFSKENFSDLYEKLKSEEIDAMVISDSYINIYDEIDDDFDENTRVLYTFDKTVITEKEEVEEKNTYNILISGSDSRGALSNTDRSDVNMIVTVNLDDHKILLTSIPRDYYITLHGIGAKDKLTHTGIYGVNMTKTTLEDLFNIDIDYTVKVGFSSLTQVVDMVGGIDVYSDRYLTAGGYTFNKGTNHMDGKKALAFARERHAYDYDGGDKHRILNQQLVLEALIKKVASNKSLILKADDILSSLASLYETDIPSDLIQSVITDEINNMPSWTIEKQSVDGSKLMTECYSMPGYILWTYDPDMSTVYSATAKINNY